MKKLNEIFENQEPIPIKGIKTDSREVEEGDMFVAVKGFNINHSNFIPEAIKNKASVIVTDKECSLDVVTIKVDDIEKNLTEICKKFYDYDNNLKLIGVTGTDGKTTTTTIISELLNKFFPTAYIGTNGIKYKNEKIKTENTTPKKEDLYHYFSMLKNKGCKNIAMEVSSEALLHNRVDSFLYKYVIYTNITGDHLNIHKTMKSYIQSKLLLLNYLTDDGIVIINKDDPNCKNIKSKNKTYTYGKEKDCDFQIKDIKERKKYTTFKIKHNNKIYKIKSPYRFEYNVYNLTAAFIICYLEKLELRKVIKYIKKLEPVPGRSEYLNFNQKYNLILDYAHTENGIKTLIESIKKYKKRIIVVTGSAGGREKEKRNRIGSYLLNNVDFVIFTMDDPRNESVDDIIDEMIGKEKCENYIRIQNRQQAIYYALDKALAGDYVLIIGKGRDNYMAIGNERIPYSDYEVIEKYFNY